MSGLLVIAVTPTDRVAPGSLAQEAGLPPDLQAVSAGGLAALVAAAPEGGLKGRDRSALLPWLLSSQKLIERLMARGPVLPVALGTELEDEARVRHMLTAGGRVLAGAFDALGGAWQMDLSVRWDLAMTATRLMTENPPMPRGDANERRGLGEALAVRMAAERRRIQAAVGTALRGVARDIIITEPTDPESVVGVAMLVDEAGLADIEATLDRLDGDFDGHLTFRLVGPLAPYSFATVRVDLAPQAALGGACAVLGVARQASLPELKAAYHRAVVRLHPDLVAHAHPGDTLGATDDSARTALIEDVATAYRMLRAEHIPVTVARQDDTAPRRDELE